MKRQLVRRGWRSRNPAENDEDEEYPSTITSLVTCSIKLGLKNALIAG